jgi:hypothetical protein
MNIVNCIFDNLTTSSDSVNAGGFYLNMGNSYSYAISGNTISNISSSKSSLYLTGYPSKLSFLNNSFQNIRCSSSNGGVYNYK